MARAVVQKKELRDDQVVMKLWMLQAYVKALHFFILMSSL